MCPAGSVGTFCHIPNGRFLPSQQHFTSSQGTHTHTRTTGVCFNGPVCRVFIARNYLLMPAACLTAQHAPSISLSLCMQKRIILWRQSLICCIMQTLSTSPSPRVNLTAHYLPFFSRKSRSRFLRRFKSDLTLVFTVFTSPNERVRCDRKRLKNRLQIRLQPVCKDIGLRYTHARVHILINSSTQQFFLVSVYKMAVQCIAVSIIVTLEIMSDCKCCWESLFVAYSDFLCVLIPLCGKNDAEVFLSMFY